MNKEGATTTRRGRVVYDRKLHLFGAKAVTRIVGNLMKDQQLSAYERKAIANLLYPAQVLQDEKERSLFEEIREYLMDKILPLPGVVLALVRWLVDLEIATVTEFLKEWLKRRP